MTKTHVAWPSLACRRVSACPRLAQSGAEWSAWTPRRGPCTNDELSELWCPWPAPAPPHILQVVRDGEVLSARLAAHCDEGGSTALQDRRYDFLAPAGRRFALVARIRRMRRWVRGLWSACCWLAGRPGPASSRPSGARDGRRPGHRGIAFRPVSASEPAECRRRLPRLATQPSRGLNACSLTASEV